MILQIFHEQISPEIENELHFNEYLKMFSRPIPLLPSHLLTPLSKDDALEHFDSLRELVSLHQGGKIALDQLISQGSLTPFLGPLLPFFKNGELAPYHLFELTQFVSNELCLLKSEVPQSQLSCDQKNEFKLLLSTLESILEKYTEAGGAHLKLPSTLSIHHQTIKDCEQAFDQAIVHFEEEIKRQTGIRLIYPYPLELKENDSRIEAIEHCSMLRIESSGNLKIVTFQLSKELDSLRQRKEFEQRQLKEKAHELMVEINSAVQPFYAKFKNYYQWRQGQLFRYALAFATIENKLCLPILTDGQGLSVMEAELPALKEQCSHNYTPLSLELKQGANLLYGANMAGKTTVIKTLYFLLKLVSLGIPLPASSMKCDFPSQLEMLLKSSGSIAKKTSSFGEELEFFCKNFSPNSYIFVDELFQTTNPQSGVQLSQLVLETMASTELTFFATTHYLELIHLPEVKLYRMKEMQFSREIDRSLSARDLLGKIPFIIEPVMGDRKNALASDQIIPLQIAAHFPLFYKLGQKVQNLRNLLIGNKT